VTRLPEIQGNLSLSGSQLGIALLSLSIGSLLISPFSGWIMEKVGWNVRDNVFFGVMNGLPELWRNPALWMSFGIIFGAMIMSLLNKEFKWKLPKGELIVWGLGGGLLMGVGARIALGCNIGAFFIRVAGGDPGGWLFGIGMVVGGYGGVRFFNWWTDRKMAKEMEAF